MNPLTVRDVSPFDLQGLERIVGARALQQVRGLAAKVRREFCGPAGDVRVWHINSSAVGGGVADILDFLVPFSGAVGVPAQWIVMGGDEKFFGITKAFHNALQGLSKDKITEGMFSHYRAVIEANAAMLERRAEDAGWTTPDAVVVHDPQPAGLIPYLRQRFPEAVLVWRGHIQFDLQRAAPAHPGVKVWEMLRNFVNQCDAAVFHLPEQVPPGLAIPVRFILPSINPLALINRDLSGRAANVFINSTLSKYGLDKLHDRSVPLVLQNARFDPWKDPQGVIQAFREATAAFSRNGKRPHLILIGPLAADDPQAREILNDLGELVRGDDKVHLIPIDPTANGLTLQQARGLKKLGMEPRRLRPDQLMELEINAFQTRADVIIAKSLREGFGMAVTGAGYHGKPRIVSEVGGIPAQVKDANGNQYAVLCGRASEFSRETSITMARDAIAQLLSSAALRRSLGAKARRHVVRNFLPQRHLEDYLKLFLELRQKRLASFADEPAPASPSGEAALGL